MSKKTGGDKTSADLILRGAHTVLTADERATVINDASVVISREHIVAIGPTDEIDAQYEGVRTIDVANHLIMPGLINLHTHIPMTLLRGIAEDVDLQGFLQVVWAEEARVMSPTGVYWGTRLGALECLLGGTTTALDMYLHPLDAHRGAVEVGLRHVTGPLFFDMTGPDNLNWEQRIELARAWPEAVKKIGGPFAPLSLMPHAPLTVCPEHLAEIAALARETDSLINIHASENLSENYETVKKFGAPPVAILDQAKVLESPTVIAHGVHLSPSDRAAIAKNGASIAHCPGSNLKLASGAADIVGYRNDNINIGLGTDGCSSSNDLDMFTVMRLAANLARLVRRDPAAISAAAIVRAATADGARALGIEDRIGTVAVGKEADLIVLDLNAPHLVPWREPHTAIVFAAGRSDVRHVLVAGELVIEDRQSTRVDPHEVFAAVTKHLAQ